MSKTYLSVAAITLMLCAGLAETGWSRGFGGMHGGMRGGGMRGGFGGGGMRVGGMAGRGGIRPIPNRGGARPGFAGGGIRPGGNLGGGRPAGSFGGGNLGGNRFGSPNLGGGRPGGFSPNSSLGGRFTPSTGVGNRGPNFGGAERPGTLGRFPGAAAPGFGANQARPATLGGPRETRPGGLAARPDRVQLGGFLGLPSDGGLHGAVGKQLGRDERGLTRYPDADLRRRGDYVRRDFRGRDYYSADWYRRYPGAWYPRRWAYGNVWAAASWASMDDWFDYGDSEPVYYDYGNNVTYQDNSVYVNGQDVGTSDEYYQQAQDLASTGAEAQTTDDEQWMPLGVFAMSHDQQNKANLILQLAVNKEGIIRGNYTATLSNDTKPVQGSVDKKTQKAAWTIGDNKENVIETGIYNLTKDEAPALVHFGKDRTEQWLLVRVKQDDSQAEGAKQ